MALPWSDRRRARLFVGDTGGLMNDVIRATRDGQLTSLLAALHHDAVLFYIPRHVLVEVERDLPGYALKPKHAVAPDSAMITWQTLYAPCIRVVDVPDSWGADDPRVEAVAARHATDAPPEKFPDTPTARLAVALADCYVVTRDGDLTQHFGKHEHLDLMLAAANQGEVNYVDQMATLPVMLGSLTVFGLVQGFRKLPGVVQAGAVLAAAALANYWRQDGRFSRHFQQVGSVISDVARAVGPPLEQMYERQRNSEAVWTSHVVRRTCPPSVSEQVARVLAFAPDDGLLAADIASELDLPGSQRARVATVRAALEECEAFTPVTRHRWRLGHPLTAEPPHLPPDMTIEWLRRAHRDAGRTGH